MNKFVNSFEEKSRKREVGVLSRPAAFIATARSLRRHVHCDGTFTSTARSLRRHIHDDTNTMLSNSWIIRAVAPQIISPSTSKNHTANELSGLPGMTRPGMDQRSS